jgi:hypothetical protein
MSYPELLLGVFLGLPIGSVLGGIFVSRIHSKGK